MAFPHCAHTQIYSETIRNTFMCAFPPHTLKLTSTQIQNCCGYKINQGVLPGFRFEEVQSQIGKLEITLVTMGNNLFLHSFVTVFNRFLFNNNNGISDAVPIFTGTFTGIFHKCQNRINSSCEFVLTV